MVKIRISESAVAKIRHDLAERSHFDGAILPLLLYYHRSYSTLNDGRTVEHGPGLSLSFVATERARDSQYLPLDLGHGCTVLIGPASFFQAGEHSIDLVENQFVLTSQANAQITSA